MEPKPPLDLHRRRTVVAPNFQRSHNLQTLTGILNSSMSSDLLSDPKGNTIPRALPVVLICNFKLVVGDRNATPDLDHGGTAPNVGNGDAPNLSKGNASPNSSNGSLDKRDFTPGLDKGVDAPDLDKDGSIKSSATPDLSDGGTAFDLDEGSVTPDLSIGYAALDLCIGGAESDRGAASSLDKGGFTPNHFLSQPSITLPPPLKTIGPVS
ncbi:hypothetical protein VNO80_03532 [Phaseolus coccineus]|uniref:Uncharacterized protein n=1 Tax=Phaseolus coccineus TaxID=3886 RepID=A0AAN9RML5_PHACN